MAYQSYRVTGNRRLKPNQQSDLDARLGLLPGMMANRERRRESEATAEFREDQLEQQRFIADEEMAFEEDAQKKEFGLEMMKTGVNLNTGIASTANLSEMSKGIKGFSFGNKAPDPGLANLPPNPKPNTPFYPMSPGARGVSGAPSSGGGGFFSKAGNVVGGFQPGTAVAGGLAGYGTASLFGEGKSKEKKMLYGAAGGLLSGLLSGNWGGAISSGIGGLFGGMFS